MLKVFYYYYCMVKLKCYVLLWELMLFYLFYGINDILYIGSYLILKEFCLEKVILVGQVN